MIPSQYSHDVEILRQHIGEVIISVRFSQYVFNGKPNNLDIGALEFVFENGSYLTLDLSGDGQSVRVRNNQKSLPESSDLSQNAHCEWRCAEIKEFDNHANFLGTTISSIEAIIESLNRLPEFVSGWILRFDNNNFLVFSNFGDQGRLFLNQYPTADPALVSRQEIVATKR